MRLGCAPKLSGFDLKYPARLMESSARSQLQIPAWQQSASGAQ